MAKANDKEMESLHGALLKALLRRIEDGSATAADLAVARSFLRDNGINCQGDKNPDMSKLLDSLPDEPEPDYAH
jgi:hypothetical protein